MDYEQKYKEAFKEAEKIHKFSSDIAEIKRMEQIFPELAEDEDEKIRKFLIEDIKDTLSSEDFKHYNPEHTKKLEEALAWLEKQGEPKNKINSCKITFEDVLALECSMKIDSGESDAFCPLWVNLMCSKITPATKEQRELLFQKMHEAGYMWDSESKQLLSLKAEPSGKQKPAELAKGEDYGIDGLWHAQRILEKTFGKVDGYQTDDGILSHECAISAVKELYEKKPSWSEEDEKNLQGILDEIEANKSSAPDYDLETYDRFLSWLESLKQRIGV